MERDTAPVDSRIALPTKHPEERRLERERLAALRRKNDAMELAITGLAAIRSVVVGRRKGSK